MPQTPVGCMSEWQISCAGWVGWWWGIGASSSCCDLCRGHPGHCAGRWSPDESTNCPHPARPGLGRLHQDPSVHFIDMQAKCILNGVDLYISMCILM